MSDAGAARARLRQEKLARYAAVLSTTCPQCGARPSAQCTMVGVTLSWLHTERTLAMERAEAANSRGTEKA